MSGFPEVARRTDPLTSHMSAKGGPARRSVRDVIMETHRKHPSGLTDAELWQLVRDDVDDNQHRGLIAKRRGELVASGDLEATEMTRRSPTSGHRVKVWRLASPVAYADGALFNTADKPNPGRFAR